MKRWLTGGLGLLAAAALTTNALAADKKVTIKLSYWVPPTHKLTPGYKEWAADVQKQSGGTIKTVLFPSSQLGSGADHYDMVKRGVADMGLINPGYTAGRFPVIAASDLPFMIKDSLGAARALTRWYAKYAPKEMGDVKVCHVFTHDIGTIHTVKKEIKVPDDVKGLNIRSANETMSKFMQLLGANPVQVPIQEAKDTLLKGITDGITVTEDGVSSTSTFRFGEVVKYSLDMPLYVSTFTHNINKKFYDGLSAAQRKVIDDHCTPEWSAKVYKYWYDDQKKGIVDAHEHLPDHHWYKPTAAQVELWRKAAEPLVAEWKENVKKAGYNPDQVMSELKAELGKENALF
jgi:TRAP-type C4-dicarboxylate transport system substrate-binding protein